jgi:hypothetical protein
VFVFATVLALLLLALGIFMALRQAPKQEREWRRIQAYQELDKARYAAVPAGEQLVLTGHLQGNATLNRYELVAYRVEAWDVSTDDDGDETGSWRTREVAVPALALAVPGGVVKTAAVGSPSMGGQLHEFIEPGGRRTTATYKGRSLADGSILVAALRGDVLALRFVGGTFTAVGAALLGVMGWLTWRHPRAQTDNRGGG